MRESTCLLVAVLAVVSIPEGAKAQAATTGSAILAGVTADLVWLRDWEGRPFITLRASQVRHERVGFDIGLGTTTDLERTSVDLGGIASTFEGDYSFMAKAGIGVLKRTDETDIGLYGGVAGAFLLGRALAVRMDVTPHFYASDGRTVRSLVIGAGLTTVLRLRRTPVAAARSR